VASRLEAIKAKRARTGPAEPGATPGATADSQETVPATQGGDTAGHAAYLTAVAHKQAAARPAAPALPPVAESPPADTLTEMCRIRAMAAVADDQADAAPYTHARSVPYMRMQIV